MENLNNRLLALMSTFKRPESIGPVDRLTLITAINNLKVRLPKFLKAIEIGHKSNVVNRPIDFPELKYSDRLHAIMGILSNILGVECFCKTLLTESLQTKKEIFVIGNLYEVRLFLCVIRYIRIMVEGIYKSSPRDKTLMPKAQKSKIERAIYTQIYQLLKQEEGMYLKYVKEGPYTLRRKKVLEFILDNVKFVSNKKRNPIYDSEIILHLGNYRAPIGEFREHQFLSY